MLILCLPQIWLYNSSIAGKQLPELLTGSIFFDEAVIFTIIAEAYGKGEATDVHGESTMNTLPTPSTCTYGSLSVGIYHETDGKGMKRKLNIDSKIINILVTLSVRLSTSSEAAPESTATTRTINPLTAHIQYQSSRIIEYIDAVKYSLSYSPPESLTLLRQLVSRFNNPSTFFLQEPATRNSRATN